MITISIDPSIVRFGHLAIRWYGVFIALALFAGLWLARKEAIRRKIPAGLIDSLFYWVAPLGLVGARLFHVADNWPMYQANPIRMFYIWEGGLAIWGAVFGGLVGLAFFAWKRRANIGVLLDTIVPGLVMGQAIGRLACIITGDAVGKPTLGPLGFAYTRPDAMVPQLGMFYTPLPAYELVINLVIFGVLWSLRKRINNNGLLFSIYLALYGLERFIIGFQTTYRVVGLGMTQSQIIGLLSVVAATFMILYHVFLAMDRSTQQRGQLQP